MKTFNVKVVQIILFFSRIILGDMKNQFHINVKLVILYSFSDFTSLLIKNHF